MCRECKEIEEKKKSTHSVFSGLVYCSIEKALRKRSQRERKLRGLQVACEREMSMMGMTQIGAQVIITRKNISKKYNAIKYEII